MQKIDENPVINFPFQKTDVTPDEVFAYLNRKPQDERPLKGLVVWYDPQDDREVLHLGFGTISRQEALWVIEQMRLVILGIYGND